MTTCLRVSNKGLERVSTRISELINLVTLPLTSSPSVPPSSRAPLVDCAPQSSYQLSVRSPLSPFYGSTGQSRSFSRTVSAPVSSKHFHPRATSMRVDHQYLVRDSVVHRHAGPVTETEEEYSLDDHGPTPRSGLQAAAELAVCPITAGSSRIFDRSKTGLPSSPWPPQTLQSHELNVLAGQNRLTR